MQFNSYVFILAFIPIILIGYFGLNRIHLVFGKVFLIAASAVFYIYGGWNIAIILGISILINYIFAKIVEISRNNKTIVRLAIFIIVVGNIGLLFYYKYYNFFVSSINDILHMNFALKDIILPLGISFFTFQQIMYVVNVYKNNIQSAKILDYLVYILYFPKLLMGPLNEPKEFLDQINNPSLKKLNAENLACGDMLPSR